MIRRPHEPTATTMAVRTAIILFLFVVVFTGLLSAAYLSSKPAIEAAAIEEKMKLIDEVLPRNLYDNQLLNDTLQLPPLQALGLDEASTAYRARRNGVTTALVLEAVAPDGYSGKIRLLVAVNADLTLSGVRVIAHKETPGLGDYIEPKKDRKRPRPWITQFEGRGLNNPAERGWKVKKDGGEFDANAGATITPRAIVKAVKATLGYVAANRQALYASSGGKS